MPTAPTSPPTGYARRAGEAGGAVLRRNIVTITPAGRSHLRRLDRLLAKVQDELLAPLSPAERALLVRLLTRILEHHGAVR
ncbi:MAG TPA: MarR family winged helix-turn-helix transcriptional regulator [Streptosporangiaceae bacterium]